MTQSQHSRVDEAIELARLAALDPLSYEREREAAAERLAIRVAVLDRLVAVARNDGKEARGQGRPLVFPDIEPWPDPLDGAELLDELAAAILRHVVMTDAAAAAAALWVVHTWLFERFMVTPRLILKSAQKRAGKTTTLMLLGGLVPRRLFTANTTPAAVYRAVELAQPVLLIDEADRFLKNNPELLGLLNAGYLRGGQVLRVIGEEHDPRQFSCWCPVALASIGHIDNTLEDRSLAIALQRRRRDEDIARLGIEELTALAPLCRRIARWVADHAPAVAGRRPSRLGGLHDRAFDCWKALLAIADEAGGDWPQRARQAALVVSVNDDAETLATRLLADLKELFDAEPSGVLFSAEIIAALLRREEHGWAELPRTGKPLSQVGMARLLSPFKIRPDTVRRGNDVAKGYRREPFEDVWERYL
jgi:putative DNA primase/helicase